MKFTKNKIVRCDAGIAPQKHYLKKILSLLLSIAILFTITAGFDLSVYALESGDYEYQLLYDGTAAIKKYNGKESNVVLPSKIDGYAVSQINGFAFENCSTVKTVEISNGIKKLIGQVFFLCENLTEISIPDSMEDIDSSSFYSYNLKNINVSANNQKYKSVNGILYNKNLSELIEYPRGKEDSEFIIPSSVKVIGETTNEHLKKVTISKNVESIPYLAFDLCSALEEVIIEDGVKTIEDFAFSGCDSLNKITIPKSVTTIYGGAIGSTYNTWGSTVCGDPTIYGYKNSAAEAYAKKYSIKFIALDGECVHAWNSGKVTKAATCTANGVKTYTCTKCKATKTEAIKATGHSYDAGKVTKAPTATTAGVKTYTCTKCKATKTEAIKATGLKTPVLKAAVNANGTIKLSWGKVAGAEKYELYIRQADGSYKLMKTTNATSFTTAFATYGKQFTYKMRAVTNKNSSATSAYSSAVNATNNKKLQTPTLKVAVNANGTFKLSWNAVAGATSYQLYIRQADGSYKLMKTTNATSFTTAFAT